MAEKTCECGHVLDEHDEDGECQAEVDGETCFCVYFDEAA